MGRPLTTSVPGYVRGVIPLSDPAALAKSMRSELDKIQRAQPNTNTVSITEDYVLTSQDRTVLVDTTAGDVTITLFSAKRRLVLPVSIIKISDDANAVTLMPPTGESIGTGPFLAWSDPQVAYTLHPDGRTHWWIESSANEAVVPTLDVYSVGGATADTIHWSGGGVTTLAIDGGTPATPPASPIVVPRPASYAVKHTYAFQATKSGLTVGQSVDVLPVSPVVLVIYNVGLVVASEAADTLTASFSAGDSQGLIPASIDHFSVVWYKPAAAYYDGEHELAGGVVTFSPTPFDLDAAGLNTRDVAIYIKAYDASGVVVAASAAKTFTFVCADDH